MDVAWAILRATSLSFLGLGAQPSTPEWGAMIDEGRELLRRAPWVSLAPSTAMMLAVLSLNLVGDALRDALDPHARS
jgi:ABC-type dipeptide/oligopeptide/nickel transport system permease subunit